MEKKIKQNLVKKIFGDPRNFGGPDATNELKVFLKVSAIFFFRIEIAIKEATTADSKEEILDEAKSMIRVAKHDHIVNFQA